MFSSEAWLANPSSGFYNDVATQSLRFGVNNVLTNELDAPSDRKNFTISMWFKRNRTSTEEALIGGTTQNGQYVRFEASGAIRLRQYNTEINLITNAVFRDTSAWYHLVVAWDLDNSTRNDRVIIYVNGTRQTLATNTIPDNTSTNSNLMIDGSTLHIGAYYSGGVVGYYSGYIADVNLIDGTTLAPTAFGETKNGVWIPKDPTGLTYGNNGFRLQFKNSAVTTASSSTIGADTSGKNRHFTSSGIVASDCNMPESPENNFCVLNLNARGTTNVALSEGNLKFVKSGSNFGNVLGTIPLFSGKWYCEAYISSSNLTQVGVQEVINNIYASSGDYGPNTDLGMWDSRGYYYDEGTAGGSAPTYTTGDIINIAFDVDAGKIWFGKNNTYNHSGNPANGTNQTTGSTNDLSSIGVTIAGNGEGGGTAVYNCGQDDTFSGNKTSGSANATDDNGIGQFYYAPPSGFLALCSANLPEPTISPNADTQADDHFNTVLWTGTGSSQAITGVGFQPDWVWTKGRSVAYSHYLLDSSRGVQKRLMANNTNAEDTLSNGLTAFGTDGFTHGGEAGMGENTKTFVGWNWKAGGTSPTKTYRVVVVSDGGNKYRFRNSANSATFGASAVTLDLQEGGTYTFDQSDSSVDGHPMKFSTTSNGSHGGGSTYSTGVVYKLDGVTKTESEYVNTSNFNGATTRQIIITVANSAPVLYYFCHYHSAMGGQVNTNTTHGSTNFDGSILSVEQANTTAGFSIVTYTGTGSNATVGHGLGVVPHWYFVRRRSNTGHWQHYHWQNTSNPETDSLRFTSDGTVDYPYWNDTSPTSSVFSLGDHVNVNASGGQTYVAYCFAEVEGYSKFGSYTGNANADGTFIYTGFRPAWIMFKATVNGDWFIIDATRSPINEADDRLNANGSNDEITSNADIDFLSNGVKIRTASANGINQNTDLHIYMAFAEAPFKYANAR